MTADVRYDTVLRCDAPKCKARYQLSSHWDYARKNAARDQGWTYDAWKGDFCPEHSDVKEHVTDEEEHVSPQPGA